MSLSSKAPCSSTCCASLRSYIQSHLDPSGTLDGSEDAQDVVDSLDDCFADEGGCGVGVDDMEEYLKELRERRAK